jgi:hypothetical protein
MRFENTPPFRRYIDDIFMKYMGHITYAVITVDQMECTDTMKCEVSEEETTELSEGYR